MEAVVEAVDRGESTSAMNCYYSNLIEGHDTHPVDIERALRDDYSEDRTARPSDRSQGAHGRAAADR